eukprot:CFRG6861T1
MEYTEYKETSTEYEQELELELKQLESKLNVSKRVRARDLSALESLKETHDKATRDAQIMVERLQSALSASEAECKFLKSSVRNLEQQGDEIEQTARRAQADVNGLQDNQEMTLEQMAYVEQENQQLIIELQHVKENMKELQIELEVLNIRNKRVKSNNETSAAPTPTSTPVLARKSTVLERMSPPVFSPHVGNPIVDGVDAMDTEEEGIEGTAPTVRQVDIQAPSQTHTPTRAEAQDRRQEEKSTSKLKALAISVGKVFAPAGNAINMVNEILQRVALIEKSLSEARRGFRPAVISRPPTPSENLETSQTVPPTSTSASSQLME